MHGRIGFWLALLCVASLVPACASTERPGAAADEDRPRIAFLRVLEDDDHDTFLSELRSQGWEAGEQVEILPEDPEQLFPDVEAARTALEEWTRDGVDMVLAFSTPFARLVAEETDLPGLFLVIDPVAAGLVDDPANPEGNLTGVTFRTPADRTIELGGDIVGGIERLGYLAPSDDPAVPGHREGVRTAAAELGIELHEASFADPGEVADAVAALVEADVDAVYLASSTETIRALDVLREELNGVGLPAIGNSDFMDFAVLVLTPDGTEIRRQLARQASRLLGGARVSSVPVEDPRRFVTIVNRTAAQQLGLPELDPTFLRQADVVR